jgi:hypothetical protein
MSFCFQSIVKFKVVTFFYCSWYVGTYIVGALAPFVTLEHHINVWCITYVHTYIACASSKAKHLATASLINTRDRCYDFLKYFRRKIQRKKLAFLTQNKAKLCKNLIITLVFDKNANFFSESCQKSQKIVIITSTTVQNDLLYWPWRRGLVVSSPLDCS